MALAEKLPVWRFTRTIKGGGVAVATSLQPATADTPTCPWTAVPSLLLWGRLTAVSVLQVSRTSARCSSPRWTGPRLANCAGNEGLCGSVHEPRVSRRIADFGNRSWKWGFTTALSDLPGGGSWVSPHRPQGGTPGYIDLGDRPEIVTLIQPTIVGAGRFQVGGYVISVAHVQDGSQ